MYLALEKKRTDEEFEVIAKWEQQNCVQDGSAFRAAFLKFYAVVGNHVSRAARDNGTWGGVCPATGLPGMFTSDAFAMPFA